MCCFLFCDMTRHRMVSSTVYATLKIFPWPLFFTVEYRVTRASDPDPVAKKGTPPPSPPLLFGGAPSAQWLRVTRPSDPLSPL